MKIKLWGSIKSLGKSQLGTVDGEVPDLLPPVKKDFAQPLT